MKYVIAALVASIASIASAKPFSYTLPITRNNETRTMVAYPFWSREYPNPVVNVQASKPGKKTVVTGFASLRKPEKRVTCTIKNGLYHPWAKPTGTKYTMYSIMPLVEYVANTEVDLTSLVVSNVNEPKTILKAGDVLTREVYLSEGACKYTVAKTGKEVDGTCESISANPAFTKKETAGFEGEQWFLFSCREGRKVFVQDTDLLTQAGVKLGQITDYGSVAP